MGRRTVHPLYEVDGFVGTDTSQTFTGEESGETPGRPINPLLGGSGVASIVYTGSLGAARPAGSSVIWIGWPSRPTNAQANDIRIAA